jgi:hypothetical protein
MKFLKSSWFACLAAGLGLFVGAVAFHTPKRESARWSQGDNRSGKGHT